MNGITNDYGEPLGKLEHIFLGEIKNPGTDIERVSGYHYEDKHQYNDEKVYAFDHTPHEKKNIYRARVASKGSNKLKTERRNDKNYIYRKLGFSTFFPESFNSRQKVLDFIQNASKARRITKKDTKNIFVYKHMHILICDGTVYPLRRY